MSQLIIYSDSNPQQPLKIYNEFQEIADMLAPINIGFERWQANRQLPQNADQESIIAVYKDSVDRIMRDFNFGSVDVVHMTPDHPDKVAIRNKFMKEHTHSEDEVRFFIEGGGIFSLHINDKIYAVNCQKNDFIAVPTGVKHWFDTGVDPKFSVIRFFTHKEGWVPYYTGDEIAARFPEYETI